MLKSLVNVNLRKETKQNFLQHKSSPALSTAVVFGLFPCSHPLEITDQFSPTSPAPFLEMLTTNHGKDFTVPGATSTSSSQHLDKSLKVTFKVNVVKVSGFEQTFRKFPSRGFRDLPDKYWPLTQ